LSPAIAPPYESNQPVRFSDVADSPYFAFTWVDPTVVAEMFILTDLFDHDGVVNFLPTFFRTAPELEVVNNTSGKETVRPAESTIDTAIE
jgi:hypothetical protein